MDKLSEQIQRKGRSIHKVIATTRHKVQADPSDTVSINVARTLDSMNQLLSERMDRLRCARACQPDKALSDPRQARPESGDSQDEALGPSIWMAKIR
jgi:hypothetical protein